MSAEVTVRLFAAARDAAGVSEVRVRPGPIGPRLGELGLGDRFNAVLGVCTLLCGGRRLGPDDEVTAGQCVDVLPPFAGG